LKSLPHHLIGTTASPLSPLSCCAAAITLPTRPKELIFDSHSAVFITHPLHTHRHTAIRNLKSLPGYHSSSSINLVAFINHPPTSLWLLNEILDHGNLAEDLSSSESNKSNIDQTMSSTIHSTLTMIAWWSVSTNNDFIFVCNCSNLVSAIYVVH